MSENMISSVKDSQSPQLDLQLSASLGDDNPSELNFPCLIGTVSCYNQQIIISQNGKDYPFLIDRESEKSWLKLFSLMDGSNSFRKLQERFFPHTPQVLEQTLANLYQQGLLDNDFHSEVKESTHENIKLEQEVSKLLDKSNFSGLVDTNKITLSLPLAYGVAIEHYHLSSQQQLVYGALLNWRTQKEITQLIKPLYSEESRQEYWWLKALGAIEIEQNILDETISLPQTQALSNALQYWANCEPNFTLIVLSIWYRQRQKSLQSYLHACAAAKIPSSFREPIQNLLDNQSEDLSSEFWQLIPALETQTKQRWQEQIKLFIRILTGFYLGIENYYQDNPQHILRQVSLI